MLLAAAVLLATAAAAVVLPQKKVGSCHYYDVPIHSPYSHVQLTCSVCWGVEMVKLLVV